MKTEEAISIIKDHGHKYTNKDVKCLIYLSLKINISMLN